MVLNLKFLLILFIVNKYVMLLVLFQVNILLKFKNQTLFWSVSGILQVFLVYYFLANYLRKVHCL